MPKASNVCLVLVLVLASGVTATAGCKSERTPTATEPDTKPVGAAATPKKPAVVTKTRVTVTAASGRAVTLLADARELEAMDEDSGEIWRAYQRALDKDAEFALALAGSGRVQFEQLAVLDDASKGETIERAFDKAIAASVQLPRLERIMVELIVGRDSASERQSKLKALVEGAPDYFWAQLLVAKVHVRHKEWDGAAKAATAAAALRPRTALPHRILIDAAAARRDWKAAIAAADKYVEALPSVAKAVHRRARVLTEAGRFLEAVAAFSDAAKLGSKKAYTGRAIARIYAGELDGARTDLESAASKGGKHAVEHYDLAWLRFAAGDRDGALKSARAFRAKDADATIAHIERELAAAGKNASPDPVDLFTVKAAVLHWVGQRAAKGPL